MRWREIVSVCGVANDGTSIIAHSLPEYLRKASAAGWLQPDVRHWAHYGGIYDHLLAWEYCAGRWILSEGRSGPGFGLWSADFHRGDSVWQMRDSARILPQSLKSVGKAFGLEKIEVDRENLGLLSQGEIDAYCLRDCEVLLNAILKFRDILSDEGAVLRDTIASTSASIVRLNYLPADEWGWNSSQDQIAALSYYGGRVERYTTELGAGSVFDINSSYPAAMSLPLPTRYVGAGRARKGCWYHAHATVTVPDDLHIPPLPYRGAMRKEYGEKLLFPTGTWDGYFAKEEIDVAREVGCKVVINTAFNYKAEPWLEPLMSKWWNVRKNTVDEATRTITKLLMNSLYGKMIEWSEYETIVENPDIAEKAREDGAGIKLYPVKTKQGAITYYGITENKTGVLRHAAAASSIVSRARRVLYDGIVEAQTTGKVAYCDTDSVITSGKINGSKELGQFKHERDFECAEFLGPKMYALGKGEEISIKAKGFRLPRNRDPRELWARLSFGAPLAYETTLGFKRQLGAKNVEFQRVTDIREQRYNSLDKRCFSGVDSRPWRVIEIRPGGE